MQEAEIQAEKHAEDVKRRRRKERAVGSEEGSPKKLQKRKAQILK
jgi:hypothetical protein